MLSWAVDYKSLNLGENKKIITNEKLAIDFMSVYCLAKLTSPGRGGKGPSLDILVVVLGALIDRTQSEL